LIAAIREQTPPEHYGLLADLFEHITLFENETIASEYKKTDEDNYEVTVEVNFKKLHAESEGRESEVRFEDWIEIGAFSKPSSSNGFGKTLYRKRFLVTESNRKFTFTVNEKPALAGVDPFSLLIDRNTANNLKKPTLLVE
jgi:ABC-2 type transport system permease protein